MEYSNGGLVECSTGRLLKWRSRGLGCAGGSAKLTKPRAGLRALDLTCLGGIGLGIYILTMEGKKIEDDSEPNFRVPTMAQMYTAGFRYRCHLNVILTSLYLAAL